jgi:hypothetical protein
MSAPKPLITPHLTEGYEDRVLVEQINKTHRGMAHFAGSGPAGETCASCKHFGLWQEIHNALGLLTGRKWHRGKCGKAFQMTAAIGPMVPPETAACKYHERRDAE